MVHDPDAHAVPESGEPGLFPTGSPNAALLQAVLDSLTYPLYVIDVADYHVRLANRTARQMCPDTAATCHALTHHEDAPCHTAGCPCPIEIIKETGQPTVVEHIHYDAHGAARNVEVHAFPIFDAAGRVIQIVEYCVDITERKRVQEELTRDIAARQHAEQALRQSEARLRTLFDNAGVGLAEADAAQRFVTVNDRFCQILGQAREELIGKTVHDLTAPEDRATSDAFNAQLREGRADRLDYDKRYLKRDGSGLWVHVTVSTIHGPDRQRRFIATIEDIHERKQAEEALRESEAGLAAAQRLAHIGSWQWNIAADTAVWSEETFRIFGLPRGPLHQHREDFLSRIVPEDRQRVAQAMSDALSGVGDYDLDYGIRLPDGGARVIHAQAQVVRSSAGQPLMMHGTIQDVTERKRVEEALRDLNATLETKVARRTAELEHRARQLQRLTLELSETEDRERQRLAEILHDDLQQTLAAAKFHADLLRSGAERDSVPQATIELIHRLLTKAIDTSRSLSHELSPGVLRSGDFVDTLDWLAGQMQAQHGLVVRVQAAGPMVLPSEVLRAFLYKAARETLFNVVKHAGVKEARVRVRRLGPYVALTVSDRGRGFDPQDLKATSGFGLWSIRERIELLGGRMKIHSAKGHGSTLSFVVPAGPTGQDTSPRPAIEEARPPRRAAPSPTPANAGHNPLQG